MNHAKQFTDGASLNGNYSPASTLASSLEFICDIVFDVGSESETHIRSSTEPRILF